MICRKVSPNYENAWSKCMGKNSTEREIQKLYICFDLLGRIKTHS